MTSLYALSPQRGHRHSAKTFLTDTAACHADHASIPSNAHYLRKKWFCIFFLAGPSLSSDAMLRGKR